MTHRLTHTKSKVHKNSPTLLYRALYEKCKKLKIKHVNHIIRVDPGFGSMIHLYDSYIMTLY